MAGSGGLLVARTAIGIDADLTAYNQAIGPGGTADKAAQSLGARIKEAMASGNLGMLAQDLVTPLGKSVSLSQALKGYWQDLKTDLKTASASTLEASLNKVQGLVGSIGSGLKSVGTGLLMGAGIALFNDIQNAVSKLVNAIPDLVTKGREWLNTVQQIQQATGATAEQASALAGAFNYVGVPIDQITSMIGQMTKNVQTHEAALNHLGIATRDANGLWLNQVQILNNVRSSLSTMADGEQKATLIAETFGRGGSGLNKMVELLSLTDAQWNALVSDMQSQGLIATQAQLDLAQASERDMARVGNAVQGMANQLFTLVAPQLSGFFTWLADTISANAQQISQALANVMSFVIGLVQGVTGASGMLDSFSASMGNVAQPVSAAEMQMEDLVGQLADLNATSTTATGSTKDLTSALAAQSTAVQAQIDAVKKLDAAQQAAFDRENARLASQLTAQMAQIDAAQAALAQQRQAAADARELAADQQKLSDAQIKLQEEQAKASPLNTNADSIRSAQQAVIAAEQAIADKRQSMSDAALTAQQDAQKKQLQSAQQYVQDVQKLTDSATNRGALANTLVARQKVLEDQLAAAQKAGDQTSIIATQARLDAVLEAEKRNAAAIANAKKTDALTVLKTELDQEKAAVTAAAADTTAIKRAALVQQIADLQKVVDAQKVAADKEKAWLDEIQTRTGEVFGDQPGGLAAAFTKAGQSGIAFGQTMHDVFVGSDGKGGVFGAVSLVGSALGALADNMDRIRAGIDFMSSASTKSNVLSAAAAKGDLGAVAELLFIQNALNNFAPLAALGNALSGGGGKAAGGPIQPGGFYPINEGTPFEGIFSPRNPLVVVPAPSMPAYVGGSMGGAPVEIPIYLDGRVIARVVDDRLALVPKRR
jgi:hypothetical protein